MWYEIVPCLGIITAALALPTGFNYYFHKFMLNGNPYKRDLTMQYNRDNYHRDIWLTGNAYVMKGLDEIPD